MEELQCWGLQAICWSKAAWNDEGASPSGNAAASKGAVVAIAFSLDQAEIDLILLCFGSESS